MTTQTKHTPGPWELRCEDAIHRIYQKEDKDGWHIATLNLNDSYDYLNGKFIIQACNSHYELLDSLKECENMIRAFLSDNICASEIHKRVKSAISKAEGNNMTNEECEQESGYQLWKEDQEETCPNCHGYGVVMNLEGDKDCTVCDGCGKIEKE